MRWFCCASGAGNRLRPYLAQEIRLLENSGCLGVSLMHFCKSMMTESEEPGILRDYARYKGGHVHYETDGTNIWILFLYVPPESRRRGVATELLRKMFLKVRYTKGYLNPGTFSKKGQCLIPTFKRLIDEYPDVKIGSDFELEYERFMIATRAKVTT